MFRLAFLQMKSVSGGPSVLSDADLYSPSATPGLIPRTIWSPTQLRLALPLPLASRPTMVFLVSYLMDSPWAPSWRLPN
jgi:hypothetical protein